MTDWSDHLLAAKAAISRAEAQLALRHIPAAVESLMTARRELWDTLDLVNAEARGKA